MKKLLLLAVVSVIGVVSGIGAEKRYEANWASLDTRPIPAWFDEAKFGIFIHWGLYSVPAWGPKGTYAEWYWDVLQNTNSKTAAFHKQNYGPNFKYQDFAPMFRAELFDPAQWADVFVRSGAKYVVLTSKHHEGFCLWPSANSPSWNTMDVGPGRDLCGDLAVAVRQRGLKMGFYYSLYEWFHPVYKADFPRFVRDHFHPQFKDLVQRYKPSLIFADGEWSHTSAEWRSEELLAWLYNESACRDEVVVDDRWGKETRSRHGGYFTTEYGEVGQEKQLNSERKFEECRGIGASFGYNRNENLDDYQTAYGLICTLVDIVSKGGNLLLNIGPTADGRIPVIMQQRLVEIGDWLNINGEAIYGSRPWKVHAEGPTAQPRGHDHKKPAAFTPEDIRFTTKAGVVYALTLGMPDNEVRIRSLGRSTGLALQPVTNVGLLGSAQKLDWRQEEGALVVQLPRSLPFRHAVTFKVEFGAK